MASDFIPPTVSQIRQVNVQLRANQLLPAAQLLDLCKGTGVHEGTLKKVPHTSCILPLYAAVWHQYCDQHQETRMSQQQAHVSYVKNT